MASGGGGGRGGPAVLKHAAPPASQRGRLIQGMPVEQQCPLCRAGPGSQPAAASHAPPLRVGPAPVQIPRAMLTYCMLQDMALHGTGHGIAWYRTWHSRHTNGHCTHKGGVIPWPFVLDAFIGCCVEVPAGAGRRGGTLLARLYVWPLPPAQLLPAPLSTAGLHMRQAGQGRQGERSNEARAAPAAATGGAGRGQLTLHGSGPGPACHARVARQSVLHQKGRGPGGRQPCSWRFSSGGKCTSWSEQKRGRPKNGTHGHTCTPAVQGHGGAAPTPPTLPRRSTPRSRSRRCMSCSAVGRDAGSRAVHSCIRSAASCGTDERKKARKEETPWACHPPADGTLLRPTAAARACAMAAGASGVTVPATQCAQRSRAEWVCHGVMSGPLATPVLAAPAPDSHLWALLRHVHRPHVAPQRPLPCTARRRAARRTAAEQEEVATQRAGECRRHAARARGARAPLPKQPRCAVRTSWWSAPRLCLPGHGAPPHTAACAASLPFLLSCARVALSSAAWLAAFTAAGPTRDDLPEQHTE